MSLTDMDLAKWKLDAWRSETTPKRMLELIAEFERLRAKCDDLTINGFSSQLRQLDDLRKENARLKEVVAGYHGSGQRIQDLSDDCGLLESTNKALGAEVERLRHADAEVEQLRAERKWQPMETAPKKGELLIALTHGIVIAEWCVEEQKWLFVSESLTDRDSADIDCALEGDESLLGWLPLPKPPEVTT